MAKKTDIPQHAAFGDTLQPNTNYDGMPIRRRSDYIIGFITPAIGPNKSKKLTRPIVPTHNLRGKVWMEDSTYGFTDN